MKENMFNEEARREDIGSSVSKALLMENRGISKSREWSNKSNDLSQSQL